VQNILKVVPSVHQLITTTKNANHIFMVFSYTFFYVLT